MAFSAKLALGLLVLCIIQEPTFAHIRHSEKDSASTFQNIVENVSTQLKIVAEKIDKYVNSSHLEEMNTLLETRTRDLGEHTMSVMDGLRRQYEVERATQRLKSSLEQLRATVPEAIEEVTDFQKKFQETFKFTAETLFDETGKLAKVAGEDAENVHKAFTKVSRSAVQNTIKMMQRFHQKVQDAVKKASKS